MGGYNAIEAYANSVSDSLENVAMTIPVEGGAPLALSDAMAPSMAAGPNPFTPVARITVRLPERSDVHLAVYDLKGRLIRTLVSGKLGAGSHDFTWRAQGASGLYIVKLTAGNLVLVRRMALVR
jgi:hypothetical protein